jgi:hypothetical protein
MLRQAIVMFSMDTYACMSQYKYHKSGLRLRTYDKGHETREVFTCKMTPTVINKEHRRELLLLTIRNHRAIPHMPHT